MLMSTTSRSRTVRLHAVVHCPRQPFRPVLIVIFCAAVKGLEDLNHYEVNGKAIRVMPSQRDPSNRKSGVGNIFIKVFKMTSATRGSALTISRLS